MSVSKSPWGSTQQEITSPPSPGLSRTRERGEGKSDLREIIIEISHLKNFLGGLWVHEDVNLSVNQGEIVAILGGSGSGKTTILRSILMLLKPTEGSIKIFGHKLSECTAKQAYYIRRRWGVLFQQSALFSSLTVLENVMFPLNEFTKLSLETKRELALLKISMSGLPASAAKKFPAELSGGMQKRAALARALIMDPELLFLDEPTSGLDPRSARDFEELILHLRDWLNLTVVMVSHDLDLLKRTTDKVIFLGEGKVLAETTLEELIKMQHPLIMDYFSGIRGKIE